MFVVDGLEVGGDLVCRCCANSGEGEESGRTHLDRRKFRKCLRLWMNCRELCYVMAFSREPLDPFIKSRNDILRVPRNKDRRVVQGAPDICLPCSPASNKGKEFALDF